LVEAFQEIDSFDQEEAIKAYLITVSGTLDNRDLSIGIGRCYTGYDMSMFVTYIKIEKEPLINLPASIERLIRKDLITSILKA
jgi:hypothetical protein